jgi:hypothetical protein
MNIYTRIGIYGHMECMSSVLTNQGHPNIMKFISIITL